MSPRPSWVSTRTIGGPALRLLNVKPIKLLVFVAVINGVIAAPLLIVVLIASNDRRLMGNYVNGRSANFLGRFIFARMAMTSSALLDARNPLRMG